MQTWDAGAEDKELDVLRPERNVTTAKPNSGFTLQNVATFLTPEILQRRSTSPVKLRSTAYLDGFRGLAAFVVYIAHNLLSANGLLAPVEVAFGFENGNYYLVNFPFLRILFTGSHASVPIFFIISGFVQSRRALQMIHEDDHAQVYTIIASALFRRGFRLFIPVLGTAFCFMTLWHLLGIRPYVGHYEETFFADFKYFFVNMWYWTYIFKTNDIKLDETHTVSQWFAYNGHTWTIPIELQGSFHVLILLFVFARATAKVRTTMLTVISVYFLLEGGVYWFCFPIGAVLCEKNLLAAPDAFLIRSTARYRKPFFYGLLALGCYLGGVPVRGFATMSKTTLADQPGFRTIASLIPAIYFDVTHFLGTLSAVCLVTAVIALPDLHKIFETRVLQYLGRISFSLYLCHGPILSTLGMFCYRALGKFSGSADDGMRPWDNLLVVPKIGPTGMDLPFLLANVVILPVTLYASEICMKLFDGPSIKIAKRAAELAGI